MTTEPGRSTGSGSRARRRSRLRERSLLVNPAPVIGAALAAFSLVLGGLTLRVVTGRDPAAPTATPTPRTGSAGGRAPLVTRTSGTAASGGSRRSSATTPAPPVTSASGARAAGRHSIGGGDDA
jgi:hypothetical protein